MNFGFIIPVCCKNDIHCKQLLRCIESIKKYHPYNKIILINDSDEKYNLNNLFHNNENIIIIQSCQKGSADQQMFKILAETTLFEKAIFIQDSMILNKKLENIDKIDNITFLWHFTNHIIHWDIIEEPKTQFNIENKINTHTDLIKHKIIKDYNKNKDFLKFSLNNLSNKHNWCGCFGNLCIITKKELLYINNIVPFINMFTTYTSNRERRVNESIFSLICHFCYSNKKFNNSYDGLYYDGYTASNYSNIPCEFDNLKWCCKNEYISKISFDR